MNLAEVLAPEQVIGRLAVTDKSALLRDLSTRAAAALRLDSRKIVEPLLAREKLGSTGIGHGLALPHAYIPDIKRFFGLFVQLQKPIDFEAVDGAPVDLVFLLLSPEGDSKAHLAVLAAVARRLRDPAVANRLRATRDPIALHQCLTQANPPG